MARCIQCLAALRAGLTLERLILSPICADESSFSFKYARLNINRRSIYRPFIDDATEAIAAFRRTSLLSLPARRADATGF